MGAGAGAAGRSFDLGLSLPLDLASFEDGRALYEAADDLGYTSYWSGEIDGADGFTPLLIGASLLPEARFGTSIISPMTRGPALLAMQAASLARVTGGRFALGIGPGSATIVEKWNGVPFEQPYASTADTITFLHAAFSGERVDLDLETLSVHGFRLSMVPDPPPRILVAALRPAMLRLGASEADGVILNWVSPADVAASVAAAGESCEVACRIYVCPGRSRDEIASAARRLLGVYLNVDAYAAHHEWLGRGPLLGDVWEAWRTGDRRAAAAAVPDQVIDELFVCGTPQQCRDRLAEYLDAGVTTPIVTVFPMVGDITASLRELDAARVLTAP
jgi:probable F420-dependent oxidoreductase